MLINKLYEKYDSLTEPWRFFSFLAAATSLILLLASNDRGYRIIAAITICIGIFTRIKYLAK